MAKHTLIAYVEDVPGVLNRVASLFRRRNFNIDSLTVGGTDQPGVSRLTVVVDTNDPRSVILGRRIQTQTRRALLHTDDTVEDGTDDRRR